MTEPEKQPQRRSGTRLIYTLQDGEDWRWTPAGLLVVHPDRPHKIIHDDGRVETLAA